jgi:4,5-dihydroxyphthalate decarboxylase
LPAAGIGAASELAWSTWLVLELSLACQNVDRNRALLDGRVTIEGCRLDIVAGRAEEIFQRAFRHQEFDISELSLSTHLLTTGRGDSRYVAIPAFVSRAFRHSSIYIRADRGIHMPEDLRGKRIGVPDYQQTAGVWARGMLADEYGLSRSDIQWRMGGLAQPGRGARMALDLPSEIKVEPIESGRTLSTMLAAGDLDAVISPRAPSSLHGSNQIRRLFPDYRKAEEDYYRKTGLFPLMHVIGIRRELAERHPWLPVNVFAAFVKAKAAAVEDLSRIDTPAVTHPWMAEELARVRALMGDDVWPYGIEANRKELAALIRYAQADGLTKASLPLEDLNLPLVGVLARILYVPPGILLCIVLAIASAGVYSFNYNTFDLFLALGFGVLGYAFRKLDIPKAPLLFGLILGHTLEQSFRQAMTISGGNPIVFLKSPIAAGLLACAAISIGMSAFAKRRRQMVMSPTPEPVEGK